MDESARRRPGPVKRAFRNAGQTAKIILVLLLILGPILLVFGLIFRLIFICGFDAEGC